MNRLPALLWLAHVASTARASDDATTLASVNHLLGELASLGPWSAAEFAALAALQALGAAPFHPFNAQ